MNESTVLKSFKFLNLKTAVMKSYIPLIIFCFIFFTFSNVSAQNGWAPKKMCRFYEDNDFINLRGKGTDEAYTNGTRLDIFYEKSRNSHFVLNKLFPKAGVNSVNTYGWGIMQLMYTPRTINTVEPDTHDFPYAGALFAIRSLHSANALKKYSFKTELQIGLTGPLSFAKEAQIAAHKLIKYQRPMGWDSQLPPNAIFNINFTAEKKLMQYKKWMEVIGGTQIAAGTFLNSLSAHSLIRIGKMNPYFDGFIQRFSSSSEKGNKNNMQWQASVILRPRIEYQFYNVITSRNGNVKTKKEITENAEKSNLTETSSPNHLIAGFDYGMSLICDHNSFSITQKVESASIQGLRHHEVGNISYTKSW